MNLVNFACAQEPNPPRRARRFDLALVSFLARFRSLRRRGLEFNTTSREVDIILSLRPSLFYDIDWPGLADGE